MVSEQYKEIHICYMIVTISGLAVNTGKTKYMEVGCHGGLIPNEHIRIGSNSYEKVKTFKYVGSLLTKFYLRLYEI
jgi:hypothetical protein